MDHPSFTARPEGQRWLNIAEKLLMGRDLIGSKTFALRARESDPGSVEPADRIIAVAETLIAGEKVVGDSQRDWYEILRLAPLTHEAESVASQYRRLALLLNPNKNRLPFADQAFHLVSDAWSVLSNPIRRSLYDSEINFPQQINPTGSVREHENQYRKTPMQPQRNNLWLQQPQRQPQSRQERWTDQRNWRSQEGNGRSESPREGNDDLRKEVREVYDNHRNKSTTFWTACPFCYNLFEYPSFYVDCILKCPNCQRASQAVKIQSPPPFYNEQDTYFCCWGFYPLGISMSDLKKSKDPGFTWNPFSAMYPAPGMGTVQEGLNVGASKKNSNFKSQPNRVFLDEDYDDDLYMEISEASDDSDVEWHSAIGKKKTKSGMPKGIRGKRVKQVQSVELNDAGTGTSQNLQDKVPVADGKRRAVGCNPRRQSGGVAKDLGKLDLNVEFNNNDGDEHASKLNTGARGGHGVEDNIEGTGFFEGLDEFLSSLPILSAGERQG